MTMCMLGSIDGSEEKKKRKKEKKLRYSTSEMEMRDYFAGKALNGMLSAEVNSWRKEHETYKEYLTDLIKSAYKMADAMMKERDR